MLRRISLIAASVAMIALSALPASAAMQSSTTQTTTQSSATHKLYFPGLHGVVAWGSYARMPKFIRISVCVGDTAKSNFAVGAVGVGSNSNNSHSSNLGAVAIGYKQAVCRTGRIRYTAHLKLYTFIATNKGTIAKRSAVKKLF